ASRSSTSKNPACFIAPFLQPEPEKWNHSVGLNTKRFLEPSTWLSGAGHSDFSQASTGSLLPLMTVPIRIT
ncbi:hypothetical protein KTQ54_16325, partial [Komagataeibacter oboediens]|uniref:hypothetical protein n=1 Tax=Komagataeibacter oboediens TaxID=65958 RepID=UPI001C2C4DD2